jgi:hypothetical protein
LEAKAMMTKCKECQQPISSKAKRCPHCGTATGTSAARVLILLFAIVVGLVLFGGIRIIAN